MSHFLFRTDRSTGDAAAWNGRPALRARHAIATATNPAVSYPADPRRQAPAGPLSHMTISAHPLPPHIGGRRARRIFNDNAHADRRAPPGRDTGRGRTR